MTCREKAEKLDALIAILLLVLCYEVSWLATCGIIKLITICFGLTFSWAIATGIWLILCLLIKGLSILKSVFSVTVKK